MKVYKYESYEEYIDVQIQSNIRTSDWVWVMEKEIKQAAEILLSKMDVIEFGICHGSRTGKEQEWFAQHLGVDVLGTDISPGSGAQPNTIEWDFHDIKSEWVGNVSFIYSNSFDHTYDQKHCLAQWMKCLAPDGYCILHWSDGQLKATRRDPFGATLEEYKELITSEGYKLEDVTKLDGERFLLWIQNYD